MKQTVLRKWYIYFPVWLAIYTLPLPALVLFVIWGLSQSQPDLLHLIAAFPGTFLFALILLFPLFCMYFAVITTLQTMLDEICFCRTNKMLRFIICVLSVACSVNVIISGICVYLCLFAETWWWFLIPLVLMITGFLIICIVLGVRLCFEGILALDESKKQRRTISE